MLVYSRRAYRTALEILEFVTALYKTYDLKAVQKGPSEDLDEVVIFASKAYVAISKLDLNESADCYLVCQDHFSLYKETRAKEHLDHAVTAMWRSLNGLPLGEFERKGSPLSLYSESTISKVPDEKQETVETKGSNASTQPADAPQVSLPEKGRYLVRFGINWYRTLGIHQSRALGARVSSCGRGKYLDRSHLRRQGRCRAYRGVLSSYCGREGDSW